MKIKLLYMLTLLISAKTLAMNESIAEVDEQKNSHKVEVSDQKVEKNILETANLMDEINLLKLQLVKEKLNKSLNEERLDNLEIEQKINKYQPKKITQPQIKKANPADGPFNSKGIRLLSVTSLQNMGEMVVFSFYGRKYNRASGDRFKGSYVSIDNDYVTFKYENKIYKFSY